MNSRLPLVLAGCLSLALAACGAPPARLASHPSPAGVATPTPTPTPAPAAPPASPTPTPISRSPIIVGLDQHWNAPNTVLLMRPDGSVLASRTLPGTWLVGERAVGAYLLVANDGSGRAWTVDAAGNVSQVAPAAAAILTRPEQLSGGALIVDPDTAVAVQCQAASCTVDELGLDTGTVRELLTAAQSSQLREPSLQVMDLAADGHTVWLREVSPQPGTGGQAAVEVVGVDLETGAVSVPGRPTTIPDQNLAVSPDGRTTAGLELATGAGAAVWRLHVNSLDAGTDTDLQGGADDASEYTGLQSVLFAPGGQSVAWWGPASTPGPPGGQAVVDVTGLRGTGRTVWRVAGADNEVAAVLWLDGTTLLIQTDSTTTPGVFQGTDLRTHVLDVTSGTQTTLPSQLRYLVAVIR